MSQIENQLKNMSNFVPEIPLFKEESESINFSHDEPPLNINIIRKRNIKRNPFVPEVELIKANYFLLKILQKEIIFNNFLLKLEML